MTVYEGLTIMISFSSLVVSVFVLVNSIIMIKKK
ncbi:putative holin-like toxin [Heyndrickxia oleronia]